MAKYIYRDDILDEINSHELLAAEIMDDGKIGIEYLGKCGNDLVADCIAREYRSEWLKWERSDEADNFAVYSLEGDDWSIWAKIDGGIVVFNSLEDYERWERE